MKTLLKQFQEGAVDQFVDMLHEAAGSISKMKVPQAVVLTAPTGSGKTVIAAAAIESLLDGDAKHAKDAQATVLWITDQPDLNEQTRRKMLQHSTSLTPARLKTIYQGPGPQGKRPLGVQRREVIPDGIHEALGGVARALRARGWGVALRGVLAGAGGGRGGCRGHASASSSVGRASSSASRRSRASGGIRRVPFAVAQE